MSPYPLSRRLLVALAISVLIHAVLLGVGDLGRLWLAEPAYKAATLQAHLLPPRPIAGSEPMLKNTLAESAESSPAQSESASIRPPHAVEKPGRSVSRERAAQRKLFEHLFYPPEAVARGLEGEVRLLLSLDAEGVILDARIASGSGHAILDQAAVDAALAMRRLPDAGVRELILPVVFKLQ